MNHAALGSVTLYTQWVPAFHAVLEQEDGSLPSFYLRVAELARISKDERSVMLDQLLPSFTASSPTPPKG